MASEALALSLVPVIQGHLEGLLTQISKDYDLDLEDLKTRYLSATPTAPAAPAKAPRAPKAPKGPPANPCKGRTAKGEPCAVSAKDGSDLCHLHLKAANRPAKAKEVRVACTGKTGKGAPCQVRAQPGQVLCHLHIKAQKGKQGVRAETQVESQAAPPLVLCEPCSQPVAEAVPDSQAENDIMGNDDQGNLMSRLQAIIRSANNSDADSESEHEEAQPVEETQDTQAIEEAQPVEETQDTQAIEEAQSVEETQDTQAIEEAQPFEETQDTQAIEEAQPVKKVKKAKKAKKASMYDAPKESEAPVKVKKVKKVKAPKESESSGSESEAPVKVKKVKKVKESESSGSDSEAPVEAKKPKESEAPVKAKKVQKPKAPVIKESHPPAKAPEESEPEPTEDELISRLRDIIGGSNPPSSPIKLTTAQIRDMGFDDDSDDEFDMIQMTSPTSQARLGVLSLKKAWGDEDDETPMPSMSAAAVYKVPDYDGYLSE